MNRTLRFISNLDECELLRIYRDFNTSEYGPFDVKNTMGCYFRDIPTFSCLLIQVIMTYIYHSGCVYTCEWDSFCDYMIDNVGKPGKLKPSAWENYEIKTKSV